MRNFNRQLSNVLVADSSLLARELKDTHSFGNSSGTACIEPIIKTAPCNWQLHSENASIPSTGFQPNMWNCSLLPLDYLRWLVTSRQHPLFAKTFQANLKLLQ